MNVNPDPHDDTDSELTDDALDDVSGGTLRTTSGIVISLEDDGGSAAPKSSEASGPSATPIPLHTRSGFVIDFVDDG